jgi:hypothetical protein
MESKKVEVVKHDAIITIQLSGSFYKNIQAVLLHLAQSRESEDLTELIDKINDEVSSDEYDDWERSIETLMILCSEIETKAKEQNAVEFKEVEIKEDETN